MTRLPIVAAIALALLTGSSFGDAISAELVQVGNLRVEAKVDGTGRAPVILESGFTGGLFLWGSVQRQIGKETLTLSYERAGLGRLRRWAGAAKRGADRLKEGAVVEQITKMVDVVRARRK